MSTNISISIETLLAIIPLIFGLIMMVVTFINLTKKFEDQYDRKTKDIAIVYDDKFQREITTYIEKKDAGGDYEILQEDLNDCKENIMIYASEYYDWMEKPKEIKKLLRKTAIYFLVGSLLSPLAYVVFEYINASLGFIFAFFVICIFLNAFMNIVEYIQEENSIDEKYSEYELGRIKDW